MKRTAHIVCLAAIMLLALAVPAFATPDGSSGTVYGKAVLAPYAIVVTGGGTDSYNPLTYQGNLGQQVGEEFGSQVTVQNTGTQEAQLRVTAAQLPSDGNSTWNLDTQPGVDTATWSFYGHSRGAMVLPDYMPQAFGIMNYGLPSGQSDTFESSFRFPTSSSSLGDHFMQATISVVPQS
jgi:hypothetical protein